MNFFDVVSNISSSNEDIWDEEFEKAYTPFLINRSLSQFHDCLFFANEINNRQGLTNRQQYDFYRLSVKQKKKRFSKWAKPEKDESIQLISDFYKCSKTLAEQYASLLSSDAIADMKAKMDKGGRG